MREITRRSAVRTIGAAIGSAGVLGFSSGAVAAGRKTVTVAHQGGMSNPVVEYEIQFNTNDIQVENGSAEGIDSVGYKRATGEVANAGTDVFSIPDRKDALVTRFAKTGGRVELTVENTGTHNETQGNFEVTADESNNNSGAGFKYAVDSSNTLSPYAKTESDDDIYNGSTVDGVIHAGGMDQYRINGEFLRVELRTGSDGWIYVDKVQ